MMDPDSNGLPGEPGAPIERPSGGAPDGVPSERPPDGAPSAAPPPLGAPVSVTPAPGAQAAQPLVRLWALPDPGPVAVAAGLFGLLSGPLLVASSTGRYLILLADIVALVLGGLGIWGALRRSARLDMALAAVLMGGVSLFLWISYVTDPPPLPAGGT